MFTPPFTPRGEHYCLEELRGEQRISPPGDNVIPWGKNSPLGDFFPRGEVKNGPLAFYQHRVVTVMTGPSIAKALKLVT
jgi:hypothetical protein